MKNAKGEIFSTVAIYTESKHLQQCQKSGTVIFSWVKLFF